MQTFPFCLPAPAIVYDFQRHDKPRTRSSGWAALISQRAHHWQRYKFIYLCEIFILTLYSMQAMQRKLRESQNEQPKDGAVDEVAVEEHKGTEPTGQPEKSAMELTPPATPPTPLPPTSPTSSTASCADFQSVSGTPSISAQNN